MYGHILLYTTSEQWSIRVLKARPREQWRPPKDGWTKANSDDTMTKLSDKEGRGRVLWDHHGQFLMAMCYFFPFTSDPELVELKSCRWVVQLAMEMGLPKLVVETDSKKVVAKLIDPERDKSAYGPMMKEVKVLLWTREEFMIVWVRLWVNEVAHSLAKEGCTIELCKTWFCILPDCVRMGLNSDLPAMIE